MKTDSKGILTWPADERPRERLLRRGPQALTEAELLAILLRVGYAGTNAVELGRQIIKKFGSLRALMEAPLAALQEVKGLKGAKAAQLAAAMEIARRASMPDSRESVALHTSDAAADYLVSRLRGLTEEHFRALYLNRKSTLLEDALLAVGTVDQVRPAIRALVIKALQANASAIILGHNHPSGAAEASESDRMFTGDVLTALGPIGVRLLDHIIVGADATFSFSNSGLLDELALSCQTPNRMG
jgi:DNA repair protein RadC